ncbi:MAG: bifunctional diaminohydroxyphosphoribosylaminopyrimidine deaminase/5-amino-6-(5-phosphoribosylamino)uracil reductase RibD [Alphaproteobacteria bacterium]|nr:bifunctional diaminohydroxyphosphoribosylaminopyrimidine deaminase/5-amino-6-(5-phosphoribosylamino)uracil reductase RibD [Alphaproteobacteria bacterium]
MHSTDDYYMRVAVGQARQGLGRIAQGRPAVGCVLVKNGRIIAAARTGDGGVPHAEAAALRQAGADAKGATAYVTLEPCSHQGRTPPCADALVKAGIARCVIACRDPHPHVNGKGIARLQEAGIDVVIGVGAAQASAILQGFFLNVQAQRPWVTLKMATSMDGKIALGDGESRWITDALARRHVHLVRACHEAILVGSKTVHRDDPRLTARLPGLPHQLMRVVLDTNLGISAGSRLVQSARQSPVQIFYAHDTQGQGEKLAATGCVLHQMPLAEAGVDLATVLSKLAQEGITRLMVEGGPRVTASFLKAGLYDEILCYRAGNIIGGEGLPSIGGLDIAGMEAVYKLRRKDMRTLGPDVLEIYERA